MTKLELLKKHFGYDSFRPLQEEIIDNVLNGRELMVVMPTGGGKSMCFQLPALMLEGVTLVISPLIALMKDQVDALNANGIPAGFFNSSQESGDQQEVLSRLQDGSLKLLYVAPESISLLQNHLSSISVSLIAVDEAHCISTWGHDFRPAYTQLAYLKNSFSDANLIALTATADRATRSDIKKQLAISEAKEFVASFDRPNIMLSVRPGNNRIAQVRQFLKNYKDESGIIYCLSRKSCESLADKLKDYGYSVAAYHAGLENRFRESVQEQFIKDEIKIVVATIAFGMGIDKSNVRFVIHYNMPKNIEGYYQEIGRAGRDGLESQALLFHSYADVIQLRKFAEGSGNGEVQIAKLERMKQFAEALTCRRRMLLSYFNEYLAEDCNNCDVCLNKPDFFDATLQAQMALSAVYRMREQCSMNLLIDVLRGASNAGVMESGFQAIKTYGAGKDISWNNWQQYIIQMINQGLLEIAFHEQNHLKLTPQSQEVLFEDRKVALAVIPKPEELSAKQAKATAVELPTEVNRQLYDALKQLRTNLARKESIAPYMVFSDATLKDIASRIPQDDNQFADITGVGTHKHDKYAFDFLKLTEDFKDARTSDFVYRMDAPKKKTRKKAKSSGLTDTVMNSVELYWSGKSIEEIATDRGLKADTILSHIGKRYASHRDVEVDGLLEGVDLEMLEKMLPNYKKEGSMKPVFEHFNGKVGYGKLNLGMAVVEARLATAL
ncbi:DNA helicase RecQ [Nonlabens marinus]|uniref:DNA helicase RecQ n=1 Tax=Nonlabens marinus S1-08 TaxID=1454201 RepID=W8VPR2_9FLAO|nr:DNA helicase RecQ [Nonlabens marinus]BAO54640.1 ATP-dependent DNA helicase RecQ [Nonlabens marinus S1-08]